MRTGKIPYRIAALQIVVLVLAATVLLLRNGHGPAPLNSPVADEGLRIEYRSLHSLKDILPVTGTWVSPVAYTNVLSFADLDRENKKRKFFDLLLPSVLISKYKMEILGQKIGHYLKKEKLSESEQRWLEEQREFFGAADYQQLLRKTRTHPVSIVLAQAALESGWGESRFFEEANNIFGIWSFKAEEPRVKAFENRQGRDVYVKKYASLIEAVDDYFLTIARGPYLQFRYARLQDADPAMLVNYLTRYSEQGEKYTRRLREVIEKNNLKRYDSCRLDPAFISEPSR